MLRLKFILFICNIFYCIAAQNFLNELQASVPTSTSALSCIDSDIKCSLWASQGECQSNAVW